MKKETVVAEDISAYVADKEYTANKYVLRCFTITMIIFTIAYILNVFNIYIVNQTVMKKSFFASLAVYLVVVLVTKRISLSNENTKYFILFSVVLVYTIIGMYLTYHTVLLSVLPFLYAILYCSRRVMKYAYILTVISTVFVVYGGYYFGLCDANMALLTVDRLQDYIVDNNQFLLSTVNQNPIVSLGLYYVTPRCLIYIAFASICNSIFTIINGSLEKAQLTHELEKAKVAAEKASREKTDFLAKMSHEIRTPINAVLGMNEMILRESKESHIQNYAYDIRSSANSLLSIINEILDASKIEDGKMEIVPDNYEISSLLNDLYNMINLKTKDKGLELIFDVDSNIPVGYYGDDIRIKQVLVNLLNNAVKYTPQGTVTLTVRGTIDGENAILHYSVKDTGIGIKEEDIGKLFAKFQRIDEHRNRYIEGTGLGMNISMQLLKLMGSELKVQSEYDKGSEFSFNIVQKVTNSEPLGDFRERFIMEAKEYNYQTSYTAPNSKILVVDDNEINLRVFRNLLKNTQIQVYEAISGPKCLEILEKQSFDIIFMDHMMSGMDGIETLHAIRDENLANDTPVIMLTANAVTGAKEKYLSEGFDDFLSKPIVPDKLENMILYYLAEDIVNNDSYVENVSESSVTDDLPELEEFDFEYAIRILGDSELLYKTLEDVYKSLQHLPEKLSVFIENIEQQEYVKEYRIEVHALKSTSAMVGALLLSKLARLCEVAARNNDVNRILLLNPILLEEIEKHKERIKTILPETDDKSQIKNVEELVALFDMLKTSLKNEDYTTADFICNEVQKYQYSESLQYLVNILDVKVMNLETEDALEIIDNIKEEIGAQL